MAQSNPEVDTCEDVSCLPYSEIYSVSMVFKKTKPFTLENARELAKNVEELISFWLLAVPHFHDETRVANIKIRQPAIPWENRKVNVYTLALDIPGIHELYTERQEKGVSTFLEFLVGMGEELRKGSNPRQDGTQKVAGTHVYDALFDQYELFVRDGHKNPVKCIPGKKVSPKPKPPVGKSVAPTVSAPVVDSPFLDADEPFLNTDEPKTAVTVETTDAVDYAKAILRIQALEEQVEKQKRIIDKLTDIIKTEV